MQKILARSVRVECRHSNETNTRQLIQASKNESNVYYNYFSCQLILCSLVEVVSSIVIRIPVVSSRCLLCVFSQLPIVAIITREKNSNEGGEGGKKKKPREKGKKKEIDFVFFPRVLTPFLFFLCSEIRVDHGEEKKKLFLICSIWDMFFFSISHSQ